VQGRQSKVEVVLAGHKLPGHEVRVVLALRNHDVAPGLEVAHRSSEFITRLIPSVVLRGKTTLSAGA